MKIVSAHTLELQNCSDVVPARILGLQAYLQHSKEAGQYGFFLLYHSSSPGAICAAYSCSGYPFFLRPHQTDCTADKLLWQCLQPAHRLSLPRSRPPDRPPGRTGTGTHSWHGERLQAPKHRCLGQCCDPI